MGCVCVCARARTCVCDCGCADSLSLHAHAHTCATRVYQARRGDNWVLVEGKLNVAAKDLVKVSQLFSALLGGKHVTMLASLASSDNPIVAAGLAGVFLNSSFDVQDWLACLQSSPGEGVSAY